MDFQDLPISTQEAALRLLREAERDIKASGNSGIVVGWWVESHTVGSLDGGNTDLWAVHLESWEKYSNDGVSLLIGDPASGAFVSITPQENRATMGASELIELGESRRVGYIQLDLLSTDEDGAENWVLKVERIDPYGGSSWKEEFLFAEESPARFWLNHIKGDEDLDALIAQTS